ncbi:hypothetical protein ACYSNM_03385 [Myroides sp. LJL116]
MSVIKIAKVIKDCNECEYKVLMKSYKGDEIYCAICVYHTIQEQNESIDKENEEDVDDHPEDFLLMTFHGEIKHYKVSIPIPIKCPLENYFESYDSNKRTEESYS